MPLLGRAKQRIGERLGSGATAGEGAQNLLCAYMAAGVLVGLAANAALGWWWLDSVFALVIAAIAAENAVRRGRVRAARASRSPAGSGRLSGRLLLTPTTTDTDTRVGMQRIRMGSPPTPIVTSWRSRSG